MAEGPFERGVSSVLDRGVQRAARVAGRLGLGLPRAVIHAWALRRPMQELGIELTRYCNLRCHMCSVWEEAKHGVSLELAKTLLQDAFALGARRFLPFGAEQFMRKDFLDVLEHAARLGYTQQAMVSNGAMIRPEHITRLRQIPGLVVNVSLDGPRDVHDALRGEGVYDQAVAAVRAMRAAGMNVALTGVIMRETLATLEHIVDLAADLALRNVSYQPFQADMAGAHKDVPRFAFGPDAGPDIAARLAAVAAYAGRRGVRIYTKDLFPLVPDYLVKGIAPIPVGGCEIPSRTLLVSRAGEVYPCFFMLDRSIGNVHEAPLSELWHNATQRELNRLALAESCPGCLASCSDVTGLARSSQR